MTVVNKINFKDALEIFQSPFMDLIAQAHDIHIKHFLSNTIQTSTLLSVKTGACTEDCAYCAQSARYQTGVSSHNLLDANTILQYARTAKENGSQRFCMGASGKKPSDKELDIICSVIEDVKKIGLETCATLGSLTQQQAEKLKRSGLDFYNHNIDTSPEFYPKIISTRTFQDRLNTIQNARDAGLKICVGGILGMGESNEDRINMLVLLANLPIPPESIPINRLVKIPGTPLSLDNNNLDSKISDVDCFDFVRIIATARILMPKSYIRLSAGRNAMSDSLQALCFFAGANSVFYGDKLLTTNNNETDKDDMLFSKLNLKKETFIEAKI
ncbi:biotin synthase BioB [Helicobacter muridarum]|uniref:Biotin synthase n=1 Tax=Helicobacter muridarum TaxID=216 RepID=A0A099TWW7_9HELI|nr:biotin synthase BioB [Helicobacter muridarum]STQ85586.1 biotin synthase [Helicobacter muridarum]